MTTIETIISTVFIFAWLMWLMRQVLKLLLDDYVEFKDEPENEEIKNLNILYPPNNWMDVSDN